MIRRVLLAVALFMAAPTAAAGPSLDGYSFEGAQFEHDTIEVTFVKVRTQDEMNFLAGTFGIPLKGGHVKAFSLFNKNRCVIYAEDPTVDYEPEFIGHELTHCIFGNFHPKQSKRYEP